jgi:hypothetical protein
MIPLVGLMMHPRAANDRASLNSCLEEGGDRGSGQKYKAIMVVHASTELLYVLERQ